MKFSYVLRRKVSKCGVVCVNMQRDGQKNRRTDRQRVNPAVLCFYRLFFCVCVTHRPAQGPPSVTHTTMSWIAAHRPRRPMGSARPTRRRRPLSLRPTRRKAECVSSADSPAGRQLFMHSATRPSLDVPTHLLGQRLGVLSYSANP